MLKTTIAFANSATCRAMQQAAKAAPIASSLTSNIYLRSTPPRAMSSTTYYFPSLKRIASNAKNTLNTSSSSTHTHVHANGISTVPWNKADVADERETGAKNENPISCVPKSSTQNITVAVGRVSSQLYEAADEYNDFAYDEDYDEFNLHMTPSSISSNDGERLQELEMIHHDDVGYMSSSDTSGERATGTTPGKSISFLDEENKFECDDFDEDFVEFEEDYEIMHEKVERSKDNNLIDEVFENVDDLDVNDIVY